MGGNYIGNDPSVERGFWLDPGMRNISVAKNGKIRSYLKLF